MYVDFDIALYLPLLLRDLGRLAKLISMPALTVEIE